MEKSGLVLLFCVGKFICYICFQSFVCILMPMPNFVIMHIQVMFNYYTRL